jgi:Leucine Rich repeats (2 copies)
MNNNLQEHINQITKKPKIKYLDISNRDLSGEANLSEFTALTNLNSYNNKFENLDWLSTLPNKDKLKKLNFFGNQIQEIDFNWLFTNFPNLESLNIENNPIKTKNLDDLTSEQFSRLVTGIKDKKFRVISWQGTVLMDLLEYAQALVNQGNTSQVQAHRVYLQNLIKPENPVKTEIRPKAEQNNNRIPVKNSNHTYLLIAGLVLFSLAILAIGYWLGKKKSKHKKTFA